MRSRARTIGFILFFALHVLAIALFVNWICASRIEPTDMQALQSQLTTLANYPLPSEPSTLVLGDSTAAVNVDASELENAWNFGLASATTIETYYVFQKWLSRHPAPKCVVLSLSQDWPAYPALFWRTFVRKGFYSPDEFSELLRSRPEGSFPTKNALSLWLNYALYSSRLAGVSLSEIRDAFSGPWRSARAYRIKALQTQHGSLLLHGTIHLPWQPDYIDDPGPTRAFFDLYNQRLIESLKSHHVKIYLIKIPRQSGLHVPAEVASARADVERSILSTPGNEALDLSPFVDDDDFAYPNHLLAPAAHRITHKIKKAIESCSVTQ